MYKGVNSTAVYNKVKTYVNNKPLIVGLLDHFNYGDHWSVGIGYSRITSVSGAESYVIIINDGHGSTNVRVNLSYVDGCIYF